MTDDKAKPASEPFSMLINAIERDLERAPEGRGGAIHYTPATPRHGGMGHNGDYLLREWREVTAALAAERDRADRAEAKLADVSEAVRANGSATAQKIVEILAIKATA